MTKTILIIGTLDTKGAEFSFVRNLIAERGHNTLVMDVGVTGEPSFAPDISAAEVASAGGGTLPALREAGDRGAALTVMGEGAKSLALQAYAEGKVDGAISLGGSGGTSVAATAMQALPVGLPKIIVSTMASGDVAPYVGVKDITMMYSVVDVAGLNRISRQVFGNAVGAICGMVEQVIPESKDKTLIAASMFGVTTPCVTAVREKLEATGYEVLVFHATGSGGSAMESLINDGFITAVADITTTEWCDELVGGVLSAGPTRLDAAAKNGVPQVVSLGALDMVNFGAVETVPEQFKDRNLYVHNPQVTLMRTTPEECAELGKIIANKLNQSTGPAALFVPLNGVSIIDVAGQPFHSPEADEALFQALRDNLDTSKVELVELENNINDPEFADAVAKQLLAMLGS
ncbi:Tm-1-like ATP-binding domain-containing protein [Anaerolineales bacterium HSG24]|nr:Tm-1-like ATP-binding domain-containing protein [Anaerolineales bacterium HSG24]